MENSVNANSAAYDAILEVVRSAWALVDNTGYHEWLPLAVNRDDWNALATSMTALSNLIPADELPAEPPHAVVCLWPKLNEFAEMQTRMLCSALAGAADEKAALALRLRELEADRNAAIDAIRSTIVALDAHGVCQTMADALRILIDRVDASGSFVGEWPPKPAHRADTTIGSLSGRPTARSDFRYTD